MPGGAPPWESPAVPARCVVRLRMSVPWARAPWVHPRRGLLCHRASAYPRHPRMEAGPTDPSPFGERRGPRSWGHRRHKSSGCLCRGRVWASRPGPPLALAGLAHRANYRGHSVLTVKQVTWLFMVSALCFSTHYSIRCRTTADSRLRFHLGPNHCSELANPGTRHTPPFGSFWTTSDKVHSFCVEILYRGWEAPGRSVGANLAEA